MNPDLLAAAWPLERVDDALIRLARARRWRVTRPAEPSPIATVAPRAEPSRAVERAARWVGIEAEPVEAAFGEVDSLLRSCAPALLRLPGSDRFLAVLRAGRGRLRVTGPDDTVLDLPFHAVRDALRDPLARPVRDDVERLLAFVPIAGHRRERVRDALLAERLAETRIPAGWLLRPGPDAGALAHLGGTRSLGEAAKLLAAHAAQHSLFIGSWWLIGWMALADRFAAGWLALWTLMFAALLALRFYTYATGGRLSVGLGSRLKRQLLRGAFRLHPDEVRRQGAGRWLGRTLDVEAVESFSFSGALLVATAIIELGFALAILRVGAAGTGHALLLLGWAGLLALATAVYLRRREHWNDARLELTGGMVEQMVGHRTRAIQEPGAGRHVREDRELVDYRGRADRQDRWEVLIETLIPRGWFLVGMAALGPAFVAGGHSTAAIAAGIGGVLLGQRAFRGLAAGVEQLGGAAVAWKRLRPLLDARRRPEPPGLPYLGDAAELRPAGPRSVRPILDARGLRFRYPNRAEPAVRHADLEIFTGDRVILEGASGGGKSTLARLLSAFDPPDAGIVLLDGLDPASLGIHEWRRRVVFVPQFHDNYVLMGSFAYNLLLGRAWPPSAAELREAESVCRALGLGPLLERMPGGLFQMLGETGWQLSHGERTRLFLARAILQKPQIMVLDESFAALDPDTLTTVQRTLLDSDAAILLVAHP